MRMSQRVTVLVTTASVFAVCVALYKFGGANNSLALYKLGIVTPDAQQNELRTPDAPPAAAQADHSGELAAAKSQAADSQQKVTQLQATVAEMQRKLDAQQNELRTPASVTQPCTAAPTQPCPDPAVASAPVAATKTAFARNTMDAFHSSGITKEHVLAKNMAQCVRFAFINGALHKCSPFGGNTEYSRTVKYLKQLSTAVKSKGAVWNHCFEDMGIKSRGQPKGLYLSKASHPETWDIASPDWDFLTEGSFKPWSNRLSELNSAAKAKPFASKETKMFFRGKFTGRDWPADHAGSSRMTAEPNSKEYSFGKLNPRYTMFMMGKQGKTPGGVPLDLKITGRGPEIADQGLRTLFDHTGPWAPKVPMSKHCDYKYLLSISGRGSQGIRIKELMACGSLVFMHNSPHLESYYHLIEPWVHVVPYASDSSDLMKVVDWADKHPHAAALIAENGHRLVNDLINTNYADQWWGQFFDEFNALRKFKMSEVTSGCTKV